VPVEPEENEHPPHLARPARDREGPAVTSRVLSGGQHQTHSARVDERQPVEIKQHALVPLAQRGEALRDRFRRDDIELAAKLDTCPCAVMRHKNVEG
jgi:hypothetical protein